MKRICVISILLAVVMTACTQRQTVVGHIDGLTDEVILRTYVKISEMSNQGAAVSDTIYADMGRFAFDVPDDDAYYVRLRPMQAAEEMPGGVRWYGSISEISLYVDKGEHIRVNGLIDSLCVEYSSKGSRLNSDYSSLRAETMPLLRQSLHIMRKAHNASSDREYMEIMKDYSGINEQVRQVNLDFIRKHPDRVLAGLLLSYAPVDSVGYYHDMLTDEVKESIFKPMIDATFAKAEAARLKLEAQKRIVAGNVAPDFTLKTDEGKDFTLSSLRGRYVLLDFWGSWCIWCIRGFPDLKDLYSENKGLLEIVGIDCNDSNEKWLAAIGEYQLPWIHVYNPADAAPSENVTNIYNVSAFPTKILLDPEGRILEVFVGEDPSFYDVIRERIR